MTVKTREKRETHTTGDWHVQHLSLPHSRKLPYLIINADVHSVARVCQEKDARLIASAPEMHRLLERIANDDLGLVENAVECAIEAREILAKVEGGGA